MYLGRPPEERRCDPNVRRRAGKTTSRAPHCGSWTTESNRAHGILIISFGLARNADICVSVSHFEGHPNVVMEAASLDCPLVLSEIGSHREMFDEGSASWAQAGSPSSISDAIISVLHDPLTARKHARRARDVASKFSWPRLRTNIDRFMKPSSRVIDNQRDFAGTNLRRINRLILPAKRRRN